MRYEIDAATLDSMLAILVGNTLGSLSHPRSVAVAIDAASRIVDAFHITEETHNAALSLFGRRVVRCAVES